jgi:hypothetical protein
VRTGGCGIPVGNWGLSVLSPNFPHIRFTLSEMVSVSRFVEDAAKLMDAAETAAQTGHPPSHLTILLGCEGGMRIIADSDWPLDSLQSYHGAPTVYRVSRLREKVRVEGREGLRRCLFESPISQFAAKLILNPLGR